MSERYSKLFTLSENLYATGSPVVIAAGALLKDTQTGKVLAQLKLRNIGKKTIKAATVLVKPLDTVGIPLGEPVTYQYLDLHADRDADFGQKTPIALPDSATRSFAASVVQVIFTDNSIWNTDSGEWKPLSRPKPLDALGDSELAKQFRIEYGGGCENLLLEQKDLWHCVCGAVNRQEETNCHKCHKVLAELQAIDMEDLRKKKEERVAKENAEAEAARIKAKQEAEIATAKAKKVWKIAAIVVPVLLIAIVVAIIISGAAKKNNAYDNALALLENGQYEEAIQAFSLLGDYKDSTEKVQTAQNEQKYVNAIALLDVGKYDEAIETFSELGNYRDSIDCILNAKYDWALALLEVENYKDSYALFENLGDYKDANRYFDRFQQIYLLISEISTDYTKEYQYRNGQLVEEQFKSSGISIITQYEYDAQGNTISIHYCQNGKEINTHTYDYDANGNVTVYHYYVDGLEQFTHAYEYDANGRVIKDTYDSFPSPCWYSYEYDTNGNKIREKLYYVGEEDAYYSDQYEYDDNNQPTVQIREYSNGLKYSWTYENTYDEQNRMIKQVTTDSTGAVETVVYKYDSEGNCSYKKKNNDNGLVYEYHYQYDNDGNMIRKTYEYYSNGELKENITEYIYDYTITYQP